VVHAENPPNGPLPAPTRWGTLRRQPQTPENRPHSGIGYHTPASVHYGTAHDVRAQRKETLDAAYAINPARFRHRKPEPPKLPTIAWINEPVSEEELAQKAS
jgi:putative transposase